MTATTIVNPSTLILSTNAGFRLWGSAISTAIAAVGWTQTADTGQVNWTTVTVPATNAVTVYEIWKMADSLQATDPVFIRINYMVNASSGPRIQITAGTNSDGAGTITSAANTGVSVTNAFDVMNGGTTPLPAATVHNSYVNGDTSSLVLLLHFNVAGSNLSSGLYVIERRRNSDGTPAAGGFQAFSFPPVGNVSVNCQTVYTNNVYAQPANSTNTGPCFIGRVINAGNPQGVRAGATPVFPCFTGSYPELGCPSKWLLGCFAADIPLGTTFTCTHYGSTQTFVSCGLLWPALNSQAFSATTSGYLTPCVRID